MIPPRLTFITLGARDLPSLRTFYTGWGWVELEGSTDEFAAVEVGSTRLALYPIELLQAEAAPGSDVVGPGVWNGVTLALNVEQHDEVDPMFAEVVAHGATPIHEPVDRAWGGRTGYVADPEGNRWEIVWAPGLVVS